MVQLKGALYNKAMTHLLSEHYAALWH